MEVSTLGALVALIIAIVLILKKVPPVYGMMIGALIGGVIGGVSLTETITLMIGGAQGITTAVLRILAAGILAGVLIESGAATSIAETIIKKVGDTHALLALAIATMILTAVGVFVDVAVITIAPIALAIAQRADLSKMAILLAMVGGGKAGNVMSPNPNAIAVADAFHVPLTSVMLAGVIPGLCGLFLAYFIAKKLVNKGSKVSPHEVISLETSQLPSFKVSIVAPLVAISLLSLRPFAGINIDPLIALPLGGLLGALAMGRFKDINKFTISGLNRMAPVAIMLLGTGTLAGIIANSALKGTLIDVLTTLGLPSYLLAPISGSLMSLATASTTAGSAVASSVFSQTILELGVPALAGAAMIHAGATVLDHMPHGSFFHATGGAVHMDIKERLKLIPYESAVGLMIAIVSTLMFGVFGLFV
ncbi:GntP family permease [Psychromonas hadalis]|uniref:GntP family permease n=1 Tax=Psychromonas hadalis TaxID=211669 RepID=UPI0003B75216|nr:GntP family permease [Psychromonas hadalis]